MFRSLSTQRRELIPCPTVFLLALALTIPLLDYASAAQAIGTSTVFFIWTQADLVDFS